MTRRAARVRLPPDRGRCTASVAARSTPRRPPGAAPELRTWEPRPQHTGRGSHRRAAARADLTGEWAAGRAGLRTGADCRLRQGGGVLPLGFPGGHTVPSRKSMMICQHAIIPGCLRLGRGMREGRGRCLHSRCRPASARAQVGEGTAAVPARGKPRLTITGALNVRPASALASFIGAAAVVP